MVPIKFLVHLKSLMKRVTRSIQLAKYPYAGVDIPMKNLFVTDLMIEFNSSAIHGLNLNDLLKFNVKKRSFWALLKTCSLIHFFNRMDCFHHRMSSSLIKKTTSPVGSEVLLPALPAIWTRAASSNTS